MELTALARKNKAIILGIFAQEELEKRILALGLDIGAELELKYIAPFKGPVCIKTNGKLIVIRRKEAKMIQVKLL